MHMRLIRSHIDSKPPQAGKSSKLMASNSNWRNILNNDHFSRTGQGSMVKWGKSRP